MDPSIITVIFLRSQESFNGKSCRLSWEAMIYIWLAWFPGNSGGKKQSTKAFATLPFTSWERYKGYCAVKKSWEARKPFVSGKTHLAGVSFPSHQAGAWDNATMQEVCSISWQLEGEQAWPKRCSCSCWHQKYSYMHTGINCASCTTSQIAILISWLGLVNEAEQFVITASEGLIHSN